MAETANDKANKFLDRMFAERIIAMQAAYIEWKRGEGAEAAMSWIENTLDGPDLIPDLATEARSAQQYFDEEVAALDVHYAAAVKEGGPA